MFSSCKLEKEVNGSLSDAYPGGYGPLPGICAQDSLGMMPCLDACLKWPFLWHWTAKQHENREERENC